MDSLLESVKKQDSDLANEWASRDQWGTVEQLLAHADHSSISASMEQLSDANSSTTRGRSWTCIHCTFINPPNLTSCEICNLPHQA